MSIALAQQQVNFWWVLVGIGLVVVACVIVLLNFLTALVKDVDRYVARIEVEVKAGAKNTGNSPLLRDAADLIDEMGQELDRHASLLRNWKV